MSSDACETQLLVLDIQLGLSAMSYSKEEDRAYKYLYDLADDERLGVLTGDKAVAFFAKSKLPVSVLGEIWQIADGENNGFLTVERFKVALRLIAHAQQGEAISEELAANPAPLASFDGIVVPGVGPTSAPAPITIPKVSQEDKTKFLRSFVSANPGGGLLDGEKARDIFIKSNLPFTQLSTIWQLADTQSRGALDATEFILGMHLIQLAMTNALPPSGLPTTLPPGLYESAHVPTPGSPVQPIARQTTGILKPQVTGDRAIQRQNTGQRVQFSSTAAVSPTSPTRAFSRPAAATPWDVSADEKARSDVFFDGLDTTKRGFIEGDQAVPFFLESQLPDTVLAQVWDLSDIRKQGRLNKEEFAVAMKLINDHLDGKPVPSDGVLPPGLLPPSYRTTAPVPSGAFNVPQPTAPPQAPQLTGPQKDLFSLMDDDEPSSIPATTQPAASAPLSPQHTSGSLHSQASQAVPQARGVSPQPTGSQPAYSSFQGAFTIPAPTSPTPSASQAPSSPALAQAPQQFSSRTGATTADDFLSSGNASVSNDGAQLGQVQNELNASTRGVSTLQKQREELQATEKATADELAELKDRLKVSRDAFEKEQKLVNELSIKAGEQKKELEAARAELITAESELSALRDERRETEGSLLRDKEEIRSLKAKIAEIGQELGVAKAEAEKLKKEGRQQKGLHAITKKQLSTAESDLDKAQREVQELQTAAPTLETSATHFSAVDHVAVAQAPVPRSAAASPSPAASVRSTNPFERLVQSSTAATTPPVPAVASFQQEVPASAEPTKHAVAAPVSEDPFATHAAPEAPADGFEDDFASAPVPATQAALDTSFADAAEPSAKEVLEQAPTTATGAPAQDLHIPVQTGVANAVPEAEQASASGVQDVDSSDEEEGGPEDLDQPRKAPALPGSFDAAPSERFKTPGPPSTTSSVDHFEDARPSPGPQAALNASQSSGPPLFKGVTDQVPLGYASMPLSGPAVSDSQAVAAPKAADAFEDDFEKEFVNLSPTTTGGHAMPQFDDDDFGVDDFDEAFGGKPSASGGSAAGFAGFEDSFDAAPAFNATPPQLPSRTETKAAQPTASPAAEDDIKAVKELSGMGFSRSKVITALESNNYDTEKALNALLAAA